MKFKHPSDLNGPRRILFLQGHPSAFCGQLYDALKIAGHHVTKINLCLADSIFWGRRPAKSYRGRFEGWEKYLGKVIDDEGITDIIYYADRLPYHAVALDYAKRNGIATWAIEFGYLRPDWLTFEPEAMGALSTFPKEENKVRALAKSAAPLDRTVRYPYGFGTEAFHEVSYNLTQAFGRPFYPLYRSDKIYWPAFEYISWLGELALDRRRQRIARELQNRAMQPDFSYNLVALQLQADYQIRSCPEVQDIAVFLERVFASFAKSAPKTRHLIVKSHPLDSGLAGWMRRVPRLAKKAGLEGRIHVIKGGELNPLIQHSAGVLLVNSTVALHALRLEIPVFAMGSAVYNQPKLTHQGPLDAFWTTPEPVDMDFFEAFEKALGTIQIKGSFYNPEGAKAAIRTICAGFAPCDAPSLGQDIAKPADANRA